jgi:hypothetical protein
MLSRSHDFIPCGPFHGFFRYVGQSGEQDAREKEMEENMNEVCDIFVPYYHRTTISEEGQALLVLEICFTCTCWIMSAKPQPTTQR